VLVCTDLLSRGVGTPVSLFVCGVSRTCANDSFGFCVFVNRAWVYTRTILQKKKKKKKCKDVKNLTLVVNYDLPIVQGTQNEAGTLRNDGADFRTNNFFI
jgi:superfamily II DNA/RNA helicase